MAFDAFIKIDGIDGESTDDKHKNEIEILSYEWGLANPSSPGGGSGGKAQFQAFHFVSRQQQSSPRLFQSCASGTHIKTALITIRKSGSSSVEFMKLTLTDVLVSSFEELGSPDEPDLKPNNKLGLSFGKIQIEYTPILSAGKAGTSVKAGWDVIGNKPA